MHFPPTILRACWFLAGPTACGKSACGLEVAERIGAEIVALDSMTVYRGLNIGTAKPTAAERQRVPHHLFDLVDPHQEFSVAEYLTAAERVCHEILARGQTPLFVGGTGLYLRSLLRGVFKGPAADWDFRRGLESVATTEGAEALHCRLAAIDPPTAMRLHPNDQRRIIRALEIHHLTGHPASSLQAETSLPESERPPHVYWLHPPRDWLHDRINRRVDEMLRQGFVDEVRELLKHPQGLSQTAQHALGYAEISAYLTGQTTLEVAVETIKLKTRQFAKRQHTWFRNLIECHAVPMLGTESPSQLASRLIDSASPHSTGSESRKASGS